MLASSRHGTNLSYCKATGPLGRLALGACGVRYSEFGEAVVSISVKFHSVID